MNNQDINKVDVAKKVTKDVADSALSAVPFVGPAWNIAKSIYGGALNLRRDRAEDWLLFISENPDVFREELFSSTEFQDAFVYTLEKYIRERNDRKREFIKKIFLGFANTTDKERFDLERMINTLSLISYDGMQLLALLKVLISESGGSKYLSDSLLDYLVKDSNNNPEKYNSRQNENVRDVWSDAEADLISVGVLRTYNVARWGGKGYKPHYDYNLTKFGEQLIEYITK